MMNRKQRRAAGMPKQKQPTYNFNREQLHIMTQNEVQKEIDEIRQAILADAMTLLLTIPMEVLMDHFWTKSYRSKIPKFTELVIEYFDKWQNGELNMEEMKEDLWEHGGVRLEANLKEEK